MNSRSFFESSMELAFYLGISKIEFLEMTPKELKIYAEMQAKRRKDDELGYWQRTAQICCLFANINRDPKKKRTPYKIEEFMPRFKADKQQKQQTVDQMYQALKLITLASGGEVIE